MTYLMGIENSFIKFESGFSDDSYFKQFFSFHLGRNLNLNFIYGFQIGKKKLLATMFLSHSNSGMDLNLGGLCLG